jgi:ACS family hexuronate transporter-like MFS transporter
MHSAPRNSDSSAFTPVQWKIATLLFAMILLNYLDRVVLSIVSPTLRTELHLSPAQYAVALNAFLAAYAMMYLGSGLMLDRTGARLGLSFFVLTWSIISALHGLTASLGSLVLFRFLLGLTEPGGWTGAVKAVSEQFRPSQRGLASGIFTAGAGVGALIAPPLVVYLMIHYGWRSAFWVTGLSGLVWVPCWWRVTRGWAAQPAARASVLKQLPEVLRTREAWAYAALRFFGDTTGYFFLFWLPEYLVNSKQFSITAVGALAWIPFCWQDIGSIAGGFGSGWLVRKGAVPIQARKIMMSVAAIAVILGTLLQGANEPLWVIVSVSLCTLGVGAWAANMHAVPADVFTADRVATVHGFGGSAGALGGILFNWLVGQLTTSGHYSIVFTVLATLQPIGTAALWIWVRGRAADPARP